MTYTELLNSIEEQLDSDKFPTLQFPKGYDKVGFFKDFSLITENRLEYLMKHYKELIDFTLLAQNELEVRKTYF